MIKIYEEDRGYGWGETYHEFTDEIELFDWIKCFIRVDESPKLIVTNTTISEHIGIYEYHKYINKIEVNGARNENLQDIVETFIRVESEKLKEKTLLEFKAKKLELLRRLQEEFGFSVSD